MVNNHRHRESSNLSIVQDMKWDFPSFLNVNARSLSNKTNELEVICRDLNIDIICVTESWLTEDNDTIHFAGYHPPFRNDRQGRQGGGVLCLVNENIRVKHWENLTEDNLETLWMTLHLPRLPRSVSNIILGIVYHPPNADNFKTYSHISYSLDHILQKHPDAGVIITGDFNRFKDTYLKQNYKLSQIVNSPTRENSVLDKIFTNLVHFYRIPKIYPPLGLSDHSMVACYPQKQCTYKEPKVVIVKKRSNDQNAKNILTATLKNQNWFEVFQSESCEQKFNIFNEILHTALDHYLPFVEVKRCSSDKPWVTDSFRNKVIKRQEAYFNGDKAEYNKLRNHINRSSKYLKSNFYRNSVEDLKTSNPSEWWRKTKVLAGIKTTENLASLKNIYNGDAKLLANEVNIFFQSVTKDIQPLDKNIIPPPSEKIPSKYIISVMEVENEMAKISLNKSMGPDNIPNWIIRDLAPIIAPAVTSIFNSSLQDGYVPSLWKCANISPIPKVSIPENIETDLRPISLTSVLSKIFESFIAGWIWDIVKDKLNKNQFGGVKGSSTIHALVKMLHDWNTAIHQHKSVRIVLLDFKKAFDLIDHTILLKKLSNFNIPPFIIRWIGSFLSDRNIRVKINKEVSDWLKINGSVPQGSKLGPLLFVIMIDDLQISTPDTELYKYVDDGTASEIIASPSDSRMQQTLDTVSHWSKENSAQINPNKTVEMIINFRENWIDPPPLFINNTELVKVKTAKLLGLIISDDLTWTEHINSICKKASKRLYYLILLRRSGLGKKDLLIYYKHIIRPVLEYCSVVWHTSITKGQINQIDHIQDRALKIIGLESNCLESLSLRRESQCIKFFKNMFNNDSHCLHDLLPPMKCNGSEIFMNTRNYAPLPLPKVSTNRFKNSFINFSILYRQSFIR